MTLSYIPFDEGDLILDWIELADAIEAGHQRPQAQIEDVFLTEGNRTLLNRSAWIDGLGMAVKVATVFPDNAAIGKPSVGGAMTLFSSEDGALEAVIDFHLVTKWKTVADSLLAARKLARPDSRNILIIGAGTVGQNLYQAYQTVFPDADFYVWNRSPEGALAFQNKWPDVRVVDDLGTAVKAADIVTSATMAKTPILKGEWLRPGQHIDLIGAFRADMREADDIALQRSKIFVDSKATTIDHIGELKIPIASGAISESAILADYYDLPSFRRQAVDDITLFKNGGGAHLDLMTARYILDRWQQNGH